MPDALFWARLHGGATHFPLVLVFVSGLFDVIACFQREEARVGAFHASARWSLALGALGAVGAVASGLALSKGVLTGEGTLWWHHVFVWPAFALIVGLATWRLQIGDGMSQRGFRLYLTITGAACALTIAAGFFGGEMLLGK